MPRMRFNNNLQVQITCNCCGKEFLIPCDRKDFESFESGEKLIQEAFPYMPAELRELFVSGICPKCWNNIFPENEEEEE